MMSVSIAQAKAKIDGLYNETVVDVSGYATPESKSILAENGRIANAAIKNRLMEERLYTGDFSNFRRYVITDVDPEKGVVGGYTDGSVTHFNSYTLPSEREKYGIFRDTIRDIRGRLGRYIWDKFGNARSAEKSNRRTVYHEEIHNLLQLNPLIKEGGKKTEVLCDVLYTRLNQRYRESLPKGLKFLSPLFAHISYKPMVEGMAEVGTENTLEGKSAYEAGRDFAENAVTSYDVFGAAGGKSIDETGSRDVYHFCSKCADNPVGMIDKYIDGFYDSMGRLGHTDFARLKPVPIHAN